MLIQSLSHAADPKKPSTASASGLPERILSCLVALERDGIAIEPLEDCRKCRFHAGVPEALVQGWTHTSAEELKRAMWTLRRLKLISKKSLDTWPYLKRMSLRHADGRSFKIHCWTRGDEDEATFQVIVDWPSASEAPREPELLDHNSQVAVLAIPPKLGEVATNVIRHYSPGVGPFFKVLKAGIELLEQDAVPQVLDDLVTLSQVAPLTGYSKRHLERLVGTQLPPPDIAGGAGKSNKWYWSNLRGPLSKLSKKILPSRFPGSQLI